MPQKQHDRLHGGSRPGLDDFAGSGKSGLPLLPIDGSRQAAALTRGERENLLRVARLRLKVAKTTATQRSAELLADFERMLAAQYSFDQDDVWREAAKRANEIVDEAQAAISERCRELGIPARFAPGLARQWYSRGENASRQRRAELRKVAVTRIAAMEKAAFAEIERKGADIQTQLLAIGMSDEAARLLDALPSVEQLMPPLAVAEAEALLENRSEAR
jgi:hypothetical protein